MRAIDELKETIRATEADIRLLNTQMDYERDALEIERRGSYYGTTHGELRELRLTLMARDLKRALDARTAARVRLVGLNIAQEARDVRRPPVNVCPHCNGLGRHTHECPIATGILVDDEPWRSGDRTFATKEEALAHMETTEAQNKILSDTGPRARISFPTIRKALAKADSIDLTVGWVRTIPKYAIAELTELLAQRDALEVVWGMLHYSCDNEEHGTAYTDGALALGYLSPVEAAVRNGETVPERETLDEFGPVPCDPDPGENEEDA